MKKVLSVILIFTLMLSLLNIKTFASSSVEGVEFLLEDVSISEVKTGETKVYVPMVFKGTVDMQCYDIKITYDDTLLEVVEEETKITLPNGATGLINATNKGTILFSGMSLEESLKTVSGKIGVLCFTFIGELEENSVIETNLGVELIELGFNTDVKDVNVKANNLITLYESNTTVNEEEYVVPLVIKGDVTRDSKITADDALGILRNCVGLVTYGENMTKIADVDCNGKVSVRDALVTLKRAAGLLDMSCYEHEFLPKYKIVTTTIHEQGHWEESQTYIEDTPAYTEVVTVETFTCGCGKEFDTLVEVKFHITMSEEGHPRNYNNHVEKQTIYHSATGHYELKEVWVVDVEEQVITEKVIDCHACQWCGLVSDTQ